MSFNIPQQPTLEHMADPPSVDEVTPNTLGKSKAPGYGGIMLTFTNTVMVVPIL